jgi:hypothetical protein
MRITFAFVFAHGGCTEAERIKTTSDLVRETLAKTDPKKAHQQIVNERLEKDRQRYWGDLSVIDPEDIGRRREISAAKMPMLKAALTQVHYLLLGPLAPLRHASKLGSTYVNTNCREANPGYRKRSRIQQGAGSEA